MGERSYRKWFWALVLIGVVLDQSSKYAIFSWLYNQGQGDQYGVVPGFFELTAQFHATPGDIAPRVNQGALFGFANTHGMLANSVFAAVSVLAALAIVYWSALRATARDGALCVALGLILGGTLGNLYDRLVFGGVRDFIYWHYRDAFDWPVFNIADCCLVCGAFLLLAQAFWGRAGRTPDDLGRQEGATQMAEVK
jgi:lipoprotein signal peptidase